MKDIVHWEFQGKLVCGLPLGNGNRRLLIDEPHSSNYTNSLAVNCPTCKKVGSAVLEKYAADKRIEAITVSEPAPGSKLKVILRGGDVSRDLVTVEVDGKKVFVDDIKIHIKPDGVEAVVTILDVHLEYEGPTETIIKRPPFGDGTELEPIR